MPTEQISAILRFGPFELDPQRALLSRRGHPLKLQPQPLRVLAFLIARSPATVSREELADHIWGSTVHVDLEGSLNYCIRQIRLTLDDQPASPRFVETLPRQGYRFIGTLESQPAPGLAASPAPELATPPAPPIIPIPVEPLAQASPAPSRRSRLWPTLALAAAAFLVLPAIRKLQRTLHPVTPIHSLAVLPLDNLTGDPAQEYLADGLTDELTTMLAKSSTLRIISRTSTKQYKGVHRPLPEIARELGVDAILEGSLSRSHSESPADLHLTVQLIQASDDAHLWAESYERAPDTLVSQPSEAAHTIALRLSAATPRLTPARYVLPEAHDAYLRGRYLWFLHNNKESGDYFARATELQPDYAPGWAGLSSYYGGGAVEGRLDPAKSLPEEEAAARKAVALDDTLPEAHLALGAALFLHRWDWADADREIARALDLDPHLAEAWHFRAKMDAALNRPEQTVADEKRAAELDPFERPFALSLAYLTARQYGAAAAAASERLEALPHDAYLHLLLSYAYTHLGREQDAVKELAVNLELEGDTAGAANLRRTYRASGYPGVVRQHLASLLAAQSAGRYVAPVRLASLYATLQDRNNTLAALEAGLAEHSPLLLWVQNDPAYDFVRTEPRFLAVIRQAGLPLF